MMRAPKFWLNPRQNPGIKARLLAPLALVWQWGGRRKQAKGARLKLDKAVICVGNINVGGTGKTPTVLAIREVFANAGIAAHIVSRGYKGSEIGPLKVDERQHSASQVGDEALLMSAFGDVWVAKDRASGAAAAIDKGAEVILLDDGYQNAALQYDITILVIDAEIGFGNGRVLPAGPLREELKSGLQRADLIVSIGDSRAQTNLMDHWPEIADIPRFPAKLAPLQTGMDWQGLRVIAFAGIGRPAKFFNTLKAQGADIIATHEFGDHEEFSTAVLNRLKSEAAQKHAQLVTTEKDAARLPLAFRPEVLTLPVRLEFDNPKALNKTLLDIL